MPDVSIIIPIYNVKEYLSKPNTLIGGNPAKVIKTEVTWK